MNLTVYASFETRILITQQPKRLQTKRRKYEGSQVEGKERGGRRGVKRGPEGLSGAANTSGAGEEC